MASQPPIAQGAARCCLPLTPKPTPLITSRTMGACRRGDREVSYSRKERTRDRNEVEYRR